MMTVKLSTHEQLAAQPTRMQLPFHGSVIEYLRAIDDVETTESHAELD